MISFQQLPRVRMFIRSLLCGILIPGAAWAAEPAKLAQDARFDLNVSREVGSIFDGQIDAAFGKIERMSWKPAAEQPRGYTVHLALVHYAWREATVWFTPEGSGTVELSLMGPWEQREPGKLWRQEVLWTHLRADGARLLNGSFERRDRNQVPGWHVTGASIFDSTAEFGAPEGRPMARTWYNERMTTQIEVTAGQPVRLRFLVRAVRPPGYHEMARISGRDTPAHATIKNFTRGINFSECLQGPKPMYWGSKYSEDDFRRAQEEGFDHVRIPISWHLVAGPAPDYVVDPEAFAKTETAIKWGMNHKLGVILDFHDFAAFNKQPREHRMMFLKIWEQVAAYFAQQPPQVVFELVNEPNGAATTEILNAIYADAIAAIRRTNPDRTIFLGPGESNRVIELPKLELPAIDSNLIVTLHCYDPMSFTHQGAAWAGPDVRVKGIRFPGPPESPIEIPAGLQPWVHEWLREYNTFPADRNPSSAMGFRHTIHCAKEWSEYFGRPVHFGEFGVYTGADHDSRIRFLNAIRKDFDSQQIPWCMWDWKAAFQYWDPQAMSPVPGIREALFEP